MRFALIATDAAAVIAIPLATSATLPQMTRAEFVTAVRCAAYEDLVRRWAAAAVVKFRLNGEAMRQPAEALAQAHKAACDCAGGLDVGKQRRFSAGVPWLECGEPRVVELGRIGGGS